MQVLISQIKLLSVRQRIILSGLLGALITGTTFFVRELVVVSFGHGDRGSAFVLGFPLPYSTFVPCCQSFGPPPVTLDNTYFYHPLSFIADLVLWSAFSFGILYSFSKKRLLISLAAGSGATLLSLLSPPLWMVAPTPGLETFILRPMGFPFQYLTYYVTGLPGATYSGYQFDWIAALSDLAFWFGVAFLVFAIMVALEKIRRTDYYYKRK